MSGILVSGATVFVALVVLPALSLDAGARLGAATTLTVTAIPGHTAVSGALARGATSHSDVWSQSRSDYFAAPRAEERLRADLRGDVDELARLPARRSWRT